MIQEGNQDGKETRKEAVLQDRDLERSARASQGTASVAKPSRKTGSGESEAYGSEPLVVPEAYATKGS
jgi:hypothetical protein